MRAHRPRTDFDSATPFTSRRDSHSALRERATAVEKATADLNERRRDVVELEQTRPSAEWADAEAAEKARALGKTEPKRTHTAQHDRKLDDARHEAKIAELHLQRCRDELDIAVERHGSEYAAELRAEVETTDTAWREAVESLVTLAARRERSHRIARLVGDEDVPSVEPLPFRHGRELQGLEIPSGGPRTGYVAVPDVLAGLLAVGVAPGPEPEREKAKPSRPFANQEPTSEKSKEQRWIEEGRAQRQAERDGKRETVTFNDRDELAAAIETAEP